MFKLQLTREVETREAGEYATREAVNVEIVRREEALNKFMDSQEGKSDIDVDYPESDAIEGYDCLVTDTETGEQFIVTDDNNWESVPKE